MRYLLFLILILTLSTHANATHIVGGSFTYEHLGGSSYNVKLKLYRDCAPGTFAYPNDVTVQVRDGLGNALTPSLNFVMPCLGIIELDPPLDTCAVDPGICVEEAVFSSIVSLPPSATGYHLYWGVCCRNGSILNIDQPLNATELFHTYIPNNGQWLTNSSPSWVNFPPVFVCQGQDVDFDHSATDSDGDLLVYSLYTPYQNNILGYSAANPPDNITFSQVVWEMGYGVGNMLNQSGTPLSINPQTGLLTGIPEDIGQFVVGVKCEEWRDGVKIGVIVRDFQFNVVNCPPPQTSGIGPITACNGNEVTMINNSAAGAEDFYWDFGDGSAGSFDFEPTHTFPGVGDYLITLVAQQGTVCADSAIYLLSVGGVTASLDELDSTCINSSVNFEENSTSTVNQTINSREWDFGDGTSGSTVPNPSHTFTDFGDLTVTLIVEQMGTVMIQSLNLYLFKAFLMQMLVQIQLLVSTIQI